MSARRFTPTLYFASGVFLATYVVALTDSVFVLLHYHPPADQTPWAFLFAAFDSLLWPTVVALLLSPAFIIGERMVGVQLSSWVAAVSGAALLAVPYFVQHAGFSLLAMAMLSASLPLLALLPQFGHVRTNLQERPSRARILFPAALSIAVCVGVILWVAFPVGTCLLLNQTEAVALQDAAVRVERFRVANGRLPLPDSTADIEALGYGNELRPYVRWVGITDYEISYMGFDGPLLVYHSQSRSIECSL